MNDSCTWKDITLWGAVGLNFVAMAIYLSAAWYCRRLYRRLSSLSLWLHAPQEDRDHA